MVAGEGRRRERGDGGTGETGGTQDPNAVRDQFSGLRRCVTGARAPNYDFGVIIYVPSGLSRRFLPPVAFCHVRFSGAPRVIRIRVITVRQTACARSRPVSMLQFTSPPLGGPKLPGSEYFAVPSKRTPMKRRGEMDGIEARRKKREKEKREREREMRRSEPEARGAEQEEGC